MNPDSKSSFSSVFINFPIKEEPLENLPTDSITCTQCNPSVDFTTIKDKLLHDFFQHSEVTSVDTKDSKGILEVQIKTEGFENNSKSTKKSSKDSTAKNQVKSRPGEPGLSKISALRIAASLPRYECDLCDYSSRSSKAKIELHIREKHVKLPRRMEIKPKNQIDRVCLVCGQTMDRRGSLINHYLTLHGRLLGLKSTKNFSIESIQSRLAKLKKAGKWSEPTRVIPVKRTKKYRFIALSESSDDDTDLYYKNYRGPLGVSLAYHSSSDEYEEIPRSAGRHQCKVCLKFFRSRLSLEGHVKRLHVTKDETLQGIGEVQEEDTEVKEERDDWGETDESSE